MIGLLSLILFYQLNISSANELKETRFSEDLVGQP